jgi:hypothetical protein
MLLTRKRVLAAAIETTVGTAETLDANDAAYNVFDAEITPNIAMTPRTQQGGFGNLEATPEGYGASITFKTELTGDGAGGVPGWADVFFPACGWVKTGSTFAPVASAPGTNGVKTATIGVYKDGRLERARGCAGSFKVMFPTGRAAMIEWTFTGVFMAVSDAAILAPTYPTELPLRAANATFTIGGSWTPCIENLEIDAGNSVILRECQSPADASGYLSAMVSDRLPTGTLNPESSLVATQDNFGNWTSRTEEALSYSITDGTDTVVFSSSNYQITNIQPGDRGGNQVDTISFQLNADDFSIAF